MLSIVLIATFFLARVARRKTKEARFGLRGHVQTKLWEHTFEFACILTVVLLFYHLLLLLTHLGWQVVSVGNLVWLEKALNAFQVFVTNTLKLGWERALLVLLIIYVLGIFRVRLVESGSVSKGFIRLRKGLRITNWLAILLCAFTILGQEAGTPATALEIQIRKTRHEYGLLRRELNEALSSQTGKKIDEKVTDRFPVKYRQVPALLSRRNDETAKLRQYYRQFQDENGARSRSTETLLRGADNRQLARTKFEKSLDSSSPTTTDAQDAQPPPGTSFRRVVQAREKVQQYNRELKLQVGELINNPAGKDLLTHFHKLLTGKLAPNAARLLADAHPEIVPALEVLAETINDAVKYKIENMVDSLAADAVAKPTAVGDAIEASAQRISESVQVSVSPKQAASAMKQIDRLQTEVEATAKARTELTNTARVLEKGKYDRLFAQLRAPSSAERDRAVGVLARNGGKLNEAHVRRLIEMMRTGSQSWQTGSYRPPGHHCTDYEYTSVRYYAARALQHIESPHVDSSIKREAVVTESRGRFTKRVTDPGWV